MTNEVSSLDEANGWYACMAISFIIVCPSVYVSFGVTPISIFAQHITTILIIRHRTFL